MTDTKTETLFERALAEADKTCMGHPIRDERSHHDPVKNDPMRAAILAFLREIRTPSPELAKAGGDRGDFSDGDGAVTGRKYTARCSEQASLVFQAMIDHLIREGEQKKGPTS